MSAKGGAAHKEDIGSKPPAAPRLAEQAGLEAGIADYRRRNRNHERVVVGWLSLRITSGMADLKRAE